PYGTVMVFMKQSQLLSKIDNILGTFEGGAAILDENGRVLAAKTTDAGLAEEELARLSRPEAFQGAVGNVKVDGMTYSVTRHRSQETGWTFVTAMPASQFYKNVAYLQTLLAIAILVPLFGGLAFIVWILMNKYRPVVQLVQEIRARFDDH